MLNNPYSRFLPVSLGLGIAALMSMAVYALAFPWARYPVSDTWAVLIRLTRYWRGEVSLSDYVFGSHGGHMHAGVYLAFLADFDWFGGQQGLPFILSIACCLLTAAICGFLVAQRREKVAEAASFGALAFLAAAAVSWEMLLPFQFVLSIARLTFVAVIAGLAFNLNSNRPLHVGALIVLACIAVTLHGAGSIFAPTVAILTMRFGGNAGERLSGLAPVIANVLFTNVFIGSGEGIVQAITKTLPTLTVLDAWNIIAGASGFYATPFTSVVSRSFGPANVQANVILCAVGLIIATPGIFAVRLFFTRTSGSHFDRAGIALASIALFVATSAISSSMLFAQRLKELGSPDASYVNVLFTARYVCIGSLGLVVLLGFLSPRLPKIGSFAVVLAGVFALGFGARSGLADYHDYKVRTILAEASLAAHANVLDPVVKDMTWPGALDSALIEVQRAIALLKEKRLSYWAVYNIDVSP